MLIETYRGCEIHAEVDEDTEHLLEDLKEDVIKITYREDSRYVLGTTPVKSGTPPPSTKTHWVMPVFSYVHSGIILKAARDNPFSCPWDSGQSGFVYAAKKDLPGVMQEAAEAQLVTFVETYDDICSGRVYAITIHYPVNNDEQNPSDEKEEVPIGGGYVGDDFEASGLLGEARATIQAHWEELQRKASQEAVEKAEHGVPV